jgi:hypothetical protein
MASGVDRARAGATENRLDPRPEGCRAFGQTDRAATGRATAAVFRPATPEFEDSRELYLVSPHGPVKANRPSKTGRPGPGESRHKIRDGVGEDLKVKTGTFRVPDFVLHKGSYVKPSAADETGATHKILIQPITPPKSHNIDDRRPALANHHLLT